MFRDACIVMALGMSVVFAVLLFLLGLMTLGGKLAARLGGGGGGAPAGGASGTGDRMPEAVAVAVAAIRRRASRRGREGTP
jgi:Na+-transporting methylmalonyl-CoA/oxaloacetate decarboxylase gamma subunit